MTDYTDRFRSAYWVLVHYSDALRLRAWEEHGLTLAQLRILFLLRSEPNATTHGLARRLGVTMPTVSGLVDKLARAGLVERERSGVDRRVVALRLTAEGAAIVGEIRDENRPHIDDLAGRLGADLPEATVALERTARVIEAMNRETQVTAGEAIQQGE